MLHTEVGQTIGISFCTSVEADQRLVRRARDASSQGYQKVVVKQLIQMY